VSRQRTGAAAGLPNQQHRSAAGVRLARGLARALARLHPLEIRTQYGAAFPDIAEDRWRRERLTGGSLRATVSTIRILLADTLKAIATDETRVPPDDVAALHVPERGPSMFDQSSRHVRHAFGLLVRSPLVTLVATASLAIGIGANVAVFTAANALLFARTPGIIDPDGLVDIGRSTRGRGFDTVSYVTYTELRDRNTVFSGVFAARFEARAVSLGVAGGADRAYAQQVSASFFDVLGVRPAVGAVFHAPDERPGLPLRRVVLGHGFWRRFFHADPEIAGREILINGDRFVVAGVAPEGFQGTTIVAPDLWLPLTAYARATPDDDLLRSRESSWLVMGARLKPGVSLAQAQSDADAFQRALLAAYPAIYEGRGLVVAAGSRVPGEFGAFVIPFVTVLMALTGLVLLVTCANLAGLLLARSASRSREVAVRLALGASRRSLVMMFLTDAVVLCAPGAVAALVVAQGLTRVLAMVITQLPVPVATDLSVDWRVLGFAAALSLVTALATGFVPALQSSRVDLVPDLKSDASAPRRQRLRSVFVAAQMACCLLLMAVAGLLARGLGAATRVDPGFQVDGIDIATVDLALAGYARNKSADVTERLRARLAAVPGVDSVSFAAVVPLGGDGLGLGALRKPGDPASEQAINADWNVISPEFLPALRLPLVRGRNFTAADRSGSPLAAIVNEQMARDLWPGQDAIGQVLECGDFRPGRGADNTRLTVVGVAKDAKYRGLGDQARQFVYVPLAQNPWTSLRIFLRRNDQLAAASLAPEVRQALRDVDRALPLIDLAPFRQHADVSLLPQRIAASVAGSLGAVALVLSVIGMYGITAYAVASRTREIGVRIALGASRARVVGLVLRQALRLAVIGGVLGLAGAFGLTRLLADLLFGVSPLDPLTLGGTALTLVCAAAVAAWIPARRAAAVDPVVALRAD
jgi:predicted permease